MSDLTTCLLPPIPLTSRDRPCGAGKCLLCARQDTIPPLVWTTRRLPPQPTVVARRQGAYPPPHAETLPPPTAALTALSPAGLVLPFSFVIATHARDLVSSLMRHPGRPPSSNFRGGVQSWPLVGSCMIRPAPGRLLRCGLSSPLTGHGQAARLRGRRRGVDVPTCQAVRLLCRPCRRGVPVIDCQARHEKTQPLF